MSDNQDNQTQTDEQASTGATNGGAGAAPAEPPPELPAPTAEERVATLETEKAELRDRMLRIAADFDNWKKRSRKEMTDAETRSKEQVLRDFLEVIDNLERATAAWGEGRDSDAKAVRDGVDLVLRQFRSKLDRYQVKPVDAKGAAFDPRLHEAISQTPSAEAKPGTVVHELQKGYMIGDRLLRPAMVVVAVAPPSPTPAPAAKTGEDSGS